VSLWAERLDGPRDLLQDTIQSAMEVRRIGEGITNLPDQGRVPLVRAADVVSG